MGTNSFQTISTGELSDLLGSNEFEIVDARPVAAYNGWQHGDETRTGHIKNSRSLPHKWSEYLDWPEILEAKHIRPDQTVVVYGRSEEKMETVARRFGGAGYGDVRLYPDFESEWSREPELPMNRLSRHEQLVPASWVKQLIDSADPPAYENDRFRICHAHYRNRAAYEKGHLPGAVPLNTNELEAPETWNRRPPGELESALLEHGITAETTLVLYGRFSNPSPEDQFPGSSAGQLAALRCAFLMLYAGVEDVRVLNGGLQAWHDGGYETTRQESPPRPASEFGQPLPGRPELAVDTEAAKKILADPDSNLISVRSRGEFVGEQSGYNYIEKKGRIPGAVFGNCGSDAYHMENYRNLDHTTREFQEIESMWAGSGITPDKHNCFYCGTGWRASEAFFNAWLMDWPDISVYDGGWYQWSLEPENPTAAGVPEEW